MATATGQVMRASEQEATSLLDKPQVRLFSTIVVPSNNSLQVSKASAALLKHIKSKLLTKQAKTSKRNLLAPDPSDSSELTNISLWLILTTKKHISDTTRLKPSKIFLPHSLYSAGTTTICLITASPQNLVQGVLTHPAFPTALASQITKVINLQRLKSHYKSFESRRQLLSEHDLFFADDKIVTQLPELLGKVFYKSNKRPIPVTLAPPRSKRNNDPAQIPILSNRPKRTPEQRNQANRIASPEQIARQIERTLSCTPVNLAPGVTTAIHVGLASFSTEQLAANVETVVNEMVERFVPQKWKNVKAMYIKGPNTVALPVWLTTELWSEDKDILEIREAEAIEAVAAQKAEKRKAIEDGVESESKRTKRIQAKSQGDEGDEDEKRMRQILHSDRLKKKLPSKPKKKATEKTSGISKTKKEATAAA